MGRGNPGFLGHIWIVRVCNLTGHMYLWSQSLFFGCFCLGVDVGICSLWMDMVGFGICYIQSRLDVFSEMVNCNVNLIHTLSIWINNFDAAWHVFGSPFHWEPNSQSVSKITGKSRVKGVIRIRCSFKSRIPWQTKRTAGTWTPIGSMYCILIPACTI